MLEALGLGSGSGLGGISANFRVRVTDPDLKDMRALLRDVYLGMASL